MAETRIGKKLVGEGHPCCLMGEIGIDRNGDLQIARGLIELTASSGI